jgi:NAD(P)-dependent dehydrogenase (short-subunit alcohol dehydrogenase family)
MCAFHHDSTALEVIEGHDLTGYNVIVTGSNSGIGVETSRAMAKAGANVFMTCRDVERAKTVAEDIVNTTGNKNVRLEQLELDSLESVNSFVSRFLEKNLPLHILINNAGVMACPLSYTKVCF